MIHIMRTNIEIDDDIMQAAMRGSEFKTKREAVEAGLKLLARQAHYREVLKWKGKLHWDDQPSPVLVAPPSTLALKSTQPTKKQVVSAARRKTKAAA
jgi:antitoxin ParD1/3/4